MSEYENAVTSWLAKHNYEIVKENEKLKGKSKEHKVRIHALSANKEFLKYSKIAMWVGGISLFALFAGDSFPALAGLMKDLGSIFGFAGKSFSLLLGIAGFAFYNHTKNKVNEHVWIELKNYKRRVNTSEVGKFYSTVEDTKGNPKDESNWEPKYMMMFSSKGFSAQALKLAESHQIDCLTWKPGTSQFEREVWSQAEPEENESSESEIKE